jgi:integrase
MPRYLEQRRRRWYAVLDVPSDVRTRIGGGGRRVQSLGTESLTEALTLVLPVVAGWKAEFEEVRTGRPSRVKQSIIQKALDWQDALREADKDDDDRELVFGLIADIASDMDKENPAEAKRFFRIATAKNLPTDHYLDEWIGKLKDVAKTLDEKRRIVSTFAEAFPFTDDVDHAKVRTWVRQAMDKEGAARATVAKRVSFIRGYWDYLKERGAVPADDRTFDGVMPRGSQKTKAALEDEREPFTPEEVGKLLVAAEAKGDHELAALIWLAMWTGCRIEELCSLKVDEVRTDRIHVREAKTKAGNRVVPLHDRARPIVAKLKEQSKDGYLLSGLTFNKYGDRSNAIGKRFGKMKTKMGFGPAHVFHSIRKTVVTLLENAGVSEGVTADIVGHDKQSITYGLYSGGADFKTKAAAIAKLGFDAQEPRLLNGTRRPGVKRDYVISA